MRLLVTASLLLSLAACKKPVGPASMDADPGPAPAPAPAREAPPPAVTQVARNFERVNFEFDSARLDAASQAALKENASILTAFPDVKVEVQGHADERGTTEYNLALGQKRANAVRQYLVAQGVAASRLTLLSYGEERPLAGGDGEVAWAQNRRAEFRITWAGDALVEGTTR